MEPSNGSESPDSDPEVILNGESPRKHPGGRPKWVPTEAERQKVINLAAAGVPWTTIADCMQVSFKTLKRALKSELARARSEGIAVAFGMFFKAIKNGEPWAISKKLAIDANYREIPIVQSQQLGADGKPVNPNATVYVIKPEELKQISQDLKDKV
jgi:hypothetical protein